MHEITSQEQAYMNYEPISNIFNDENELVSLSFLLIINAKLFVNYFIEKYKTSIAISIYFAEKL